MNYNFSQYNFNKQLEQPEVIVALACLLFMILGTFFLQVNSCNLDAFLYSTGRLTGGHTSFLCHIF